MTDFVPLSDCQAIGELVNETWSGKSESAPNTSLMVNCISVLYAAQQHRSAKKERRLRRRVVRSGSVFLLILTRIAVMRSTEVASLYSLSRRVLGVEFRFRDPQTNLALSYGCVVIKLLDATAAVSEATRPVYTPPRERRAQQVEFDFNDAGVEANDRTLIKELCDMVYNIHEIMPCGIAFSLEPITRADFSNVVGVDASLTESTAGKKRKDDSADVLGYCLHFVGVPSFGAEFFDYLQTRYNTRYLGANVLFPYSMRLRKLNKDMVSRQRLSIMISAESALPQEVIQHAQVGAKRLCRKVNEALTADN